MDYIQNRDERLKQFDDIVKYARAVFDRKNNVQYRDTIVSTGVLGASVELIGAVARLQPLVLWDKEHGKNHAATLPGIFVDILVYAVIAMIMMKESNFDGVRR